MSDLPEKMRGWCQAESLGFVQKRDDDVALECTITAPGDPQLDIDVRASGPQFDPLLITHAAPVTVPEQLRADSTGAEQIATLADNIADGRAGLVECRFDETAGAPQLQVAVTIYRDAFTRHAFMSAIAEIRKVRKLFTAGTDSVANAMRALADVTAMVQQTEAVTDELSKLTEGFSEAAPSSEPSPDSAPTVIGRPEEMEAPVATAPAPARRFCPKCGREAKPSRRFCVGCGASLGSQS